MKRRIQTLAVVGTMLFLMSSYADEEECCDGDFDVEGTTTLEEIQAEDMAIVKKLMPDLHREMSSNWDDKDNLAKLRSVIEHTSKYLGADKAEIDKSLNAIDAFQKSSSRLDDSWFEFTGQLLLDHIVRLEKDREFDSELIMERIIEILNRRNLTPYVSVYKSCHQGAMTRAKRKALEINSRYIGELENQLKVLPPTEHEQETMFGDKYEQLIGSTSKNSKSLRDEFGLCMDDAFDYLKVHKDVGSDEVDAI